MDVEAGPVSGCAEFRFVVDEKEAHPGAGPARLTVTDPRHPDFASRAWVRCRRSRCRTGQSALMRGGRAANAHLRRTPQWMAWLEVEAGLEAACPVLRTGPSPLGHPTRCTLGWNRTSDLDVRNVALSPLSYEGRLAGVERARPWCRPRSARRRQGYSLLDLPPSTTRMGRSPGVEPGPSGPQPDVHGPVHHDRHVFFLRAPVRTRGGCRIPDRRLIRAPPTPTWASRASLSMYAAPSGGLEPPTCRLQPAAAAD